MDDDQSPYAISGELLFLASQRLKHISKISDSQGKALSPVMRSKVNKILMQLMSGGADTLLKFNEEALLLAFVRLCFHSSIRNEKIAIIGTSRAVDSVIASQNFKGIYFNPDMTFYSWQLNKAWLYAAASLGYEFRLVEQHYPNIELALLSGDPVKYILELLKEVRDSKNTSQYSGEYEPTATAQEIFVLMDLAYQARKNDDGSISLLPPVNKVAPSRCESRRVASVGNPGARLTRSHSSPSLYNNAPPPPLPSMKEHFETPKVVTRLSPIK